MFLYGLFVVDFLVIHFFVAKYRKRRKFILVSLYKLNTIFWQQMFWLKGSRCCKGSRLSPFFYSFTTFSPTLPSVERMDFAGSLAEPFYGIESSVKRHYML